MGGDIKQCSLANNKCPLLVQTNVDASIIHDMYVVGTPALYVA